MHIHVPASHTQKWCRGGLSKSLLSLELCYFCTWFLHAFYPLLQARVKDENLSLMIYLPFPFISGIYVGLPCD